MVRMATWKDGPRYAPAQPPTAFAEPAGAVSLAPEPQPPLPPPAPIDPPSAFQGPANPVPLETIGVTQRKSRDAVTPFAVASMALTDDGSSPQSYRHAEKNPYEPFNVVSLEAPVTPAWAPPPPDAKPTVPVVPVSANQVLTAAYKPMLILLVVLGFVGTTEPVVPILVLLGIPFLMMPKVGYRQNRLRWIGMGFAGVMVVLWAVSSYLSRSTMNVDMRLGLWIMLGCWLLAVVVIFMQWQALRHQERPDPRV